MKLLEKQISDVAWDGKEDFARVVDRLRELAEMASSEDEARLVISRIAHLSRDYRLQTGIGLPMTPLAQARELDSGFVIRPHLEYISNRLARAVRDVERGKNRKMAISLPPRSGKTFLVSQKAPLWMLRRHPEWKLVQASYDSTLPAGWAKNVRMEIETHPDLGIALKPDGGAGSRWETEEGGGIFTTSIRGALTGRGAKVVIIDDPIKDFVDAHSLIMRQNIWDWWLSVVQTRLEPPYLVIVVMTRWHEDDFIGRLLSPDYEGDPREWEQVVIPAIAEADDPIGRKVGEPLLSPIINESRGEALDRWDDVKRAVGTYVFSAMYQQRPAPARGAIFDVGWWRYWTSDSSKATEDGRVVYLEPGLLTGAKWVDSWDMAFKGGTGNVSDFVVGQRWCRNQANRYLISQVRDRWSFTQTLAKMKVWARTDDQFVSPFGYMVHDRLVEDRANGPAIIDTLRDHISGLKPINPTISKEARARAVTPEVESGNVYLPLPSDPGNEWVQDLLSELRNFPHDASDDQVDALSQALSYLRTSGRGGITVPGGQRPTQRGEGQTWQVPRDVARTALREMSRRRY
jgi:predicted phage terminase large subunit-like protein